MYRLVIKAGPTVGKAFPLEKNELFIGRDTNNDVVINDPELSRRHARLVAQGGSFVLEDLGSTNGTFIKGQRLSAPYMLNPGEMITFGERINLLFESVTAAAASATIPDVRQSYPAPYSTPTPQPIMPQPPQPIYQQPPPPPVYQQPPPQPAYQQAPPQPIPYSPPQSPYPPAQSPYSGQVPMPPPQVKKVIPFWIWIAIAALLMVIVVLLIDDFRLWYIFGFK